MGLQTDIADSLRYVGRDRLGRNGTSVEGDKDRCFTAHGFLCDFLDHYGGNELKNKTAFYTLLFSQILYGLFVFVWLVFLGLSVMMFDAPGSEKDPTTLTIFFAILIYPVGLLGGIISSWVCYAQQKYKLAYWLNCIPLLWLIPIVGFWSYALLS